MSNTAMVSFYEQMILVNSAEFVAKGKMMNLISPLGFESVVVKRTGV
jgi:hypothetical protein